MDGTIPPKPFAFACERVYYTRADLARHAPEILPALLRTRFENIEEVSSTVREREASLLDRLAKSAMDISTARVWGIERVVDLCGRLLSSSGGRALMDPTLLFGLDRTAWNPLEPFEVEAVALLVRKAPRSRIPLTPEQVGERLLMGVTSEGGREILLNAYHGADEAQELSYIESLEKRSGWLYENYRLDLERRAAVPEGLCREMALFERLMGSVPWAEVTMGPPDDGLGGFLLMSHGVKGLP
jgi:hypothetical protein